MRAGLEGTLSWGQHFAHARLRTVILPRQKVVYVPMSKAGSTSLLWLFAEIAGYQREHFHGSLGRAVSQEMTIHDVNAWGSRHRWKDLPPRTRDRVARDDSWLRLTTVRDPASRVWSAWQSKLLLRESSIAENFTDRSWFPRVPRSPEDVLEDFSRFVKSLAEPPGLRPIDVHWAPQTDILQGAVPVNHVGRFEKMNEVIDVLRDRLGPIVDRLERPRENSSLLRYDQGVFDDEGVEIINEVYARDFAELGYPPLRHTSAALASWKAHTASMLPAIGGYISRHQRVARLHGLMKELTTPPDRVEAAPVTRDMA
ncbi:MAG: sulfotransferase family 2 domain-containing protein [Propionibacteriales bacterium]|nr:sulfotransferase family 2 domain-containing protein [Propionibacteriales bacterium]